MGVPHTRRGSSARRLARARAAIRWHRPLQPPNGFRPTASREDHWLLAARQATITTYTWLLRQERNLPCLGSLVLSKGLFDPPQRGLKLVRQTLDLAAIERDRARLHPAARPPGPNLQRERAAHPGPCSAQRRPIDRELDLAAQ